MLVARSFVEYTVRCERGNIRATNQDNFWCAGRYLESENDGLAAPLQGSAASGSVPVFAVFDGMGGEKYGEVAAYLAAKALDSRCQRRPRGDLERFMSALCDEMNTAVCSHSAAHHISRMGTTAALLAFTGKEYCLGNIGDSKIFLYNNGNLTQLSRDHVAAVAAGRKPPLTQCLGVPPREFVIAPYIAQGKHADGDRYLLCSDGLTDMVAEEEIGETLARHKDSRGCADALVDRALAKGGVDNITVVLCDVHKKSKHGIRKGWWQI
ncbi:MAG: protein phosphatase 2C domain-containing protein [Lachnospiraceae bacterium]|jgi:protein phosphatase|nr:protein phosphatase 2C domain-containing protein [Lachnospiraceae bacterium]